MATIKQTRQKKNRRKVDENLHAALNDLLTVVAAEARRSSSYATRERLTDALTTFALRRSA